MVILYIGLYLLKMSQELLPIQLEKRNPQKIPITVRPAPNSVSAET